LNDAIHNGRKKEKGEGKNKNLNQALTVKFMDTCLLASQAFRSMQHDFTSRLA